jgi:hypothetical protein
MNVLFKRRDGSDEDTHRVQGRDVDIRAARRHNFPASDWDAYRLPEGLELDDVDPKKLFPVDEAFWNQL